MLCCTHEPVLVEIVVTLCARTEANWLISSEADAGFLGNESVVTIMQQINMSVGAFC